VTPARWKWLETVGLSLLAAGLAYVVRPSDPFLLEAEFPWLLLAPMLVALRYGALPGLCSVAVLALLWMLARELGVAAAQPPWVPLAGALVLTLLCGEFAGIAEARVRRAEGGLRYARDKLDRLTRQHYLLLTSHQRLEQDQLARPVTLRAALGRIRRAAGENETPGELPGARALLALLAQVCQLESASLHDCRGGACSPQPAAAIGVTQPLDTTDPLVVHCLEHKALAHVQKEDLSAGSGERYVVVAPVISSDGELLALLAVEQIAFLALHGETLSALAVLLGYYADSLRVSRAARVMHRALPSCPLEFVDELTRLQRLRDEDGVASSLLLLRFGAHPDAADFAAFLRRELRDLDLLWQLPPPADAAGRFDLLVLLPLAGDAAAVGAVERLEAALEARYRIGLDAARIRPYTAQLQPGDAFVGLKLFLDLHDVRV
jgi:hypothetical protein